MSAGRPAVPRELRRDLLVEAGHRCAIPTCRAMPLELAHIVPWAKVHRHDFDNMIALCPNCHTRFDQGEIDRLAMLQYKAALKTQVKNARLLDAYRSFQVLMDEWDSSISAIEWMDVMDEWDDHRRAESVSLCALEGGRAGRALSRLAGLASESTTWEARKLFNWTKRWADDVADGLWPSIHPGADRHDPWECSPIENALHEAVARELALELEELPRRPVTSDADDGQPINIGGTGKRF